MLEPPREIERRFLVVGGGWRRHVRSSVRIEQAYLATGTGTHIRIRRQGVDAYITLKGPRRGISRVEIASAVSPAFVSAVLAAGLQVAAPIVKIRHRIPVEDVTFEIDEYADANAGLVTADLELDEPDQPFPRPAWLGSEITGDRRFGNLQLARHPYSAWPA